MAPLQPAPARCHVVCEQRLADSQSFKMQSVGPSNHKPSFYGVMVSTPDSESGDPGSNPGRTYFFLLLLFPSACHDHPQSESCCLHFCFGFSPAFTKPLSFHTIEAFILQ